MKGDLGLMFMTMLLVLSAMFCFVTLMAYADHEESCKEKCYYDCGNGIKKVWEWLDICDDE